MFVAMRGGTLNAEDGMSRVVDFNGGDRAVAFGEHRIFAFTTCGTPLLRSVLARALREAAGTPTTA